MAYTISRSKTLIRPALIGLGPIEIFLLLAFVFIQNFVFLGGLSEWKFHKVDKYLPFLILIDVLIFFAHAIVYFIPFVRYLMAKSEAARANSEWDNYVNNGLSIIFDNSIHGEFGPWLDNKLPSLQSTSRPARWLEGLSISFLPPVTVTLASVIQAREFAARFEYGAFELITDQLGGGNSKSGGSITSVGRIVLDGKSYSMIFRKPNSESMIFFLFRVEVVGTVASIICGGLDLIRRDAATGEKARNRQLSDDDVVSRMRNLVEGDANSGYKSFAAPWLISCIPFLGLFIQPIFLLVELSIVGRRSPFSWWRQGELGCWQFCNNAIKQIKWEGLQPDRTSVLAELDYMTRMVQNEVLRKVHSSLIAQQSSIPTIKATPTSSPPNPGGYL